MENTFIIDPLSFAQNKRIRHGKIAGGKLDRLRELVDSDEGFAYVIEGDTDKLARPTLRLHIKGKIAVQCQRCLDKLNHEIDIDTLLILARNARELELYDADNTIDAVLALHELDMGALIEDEIILSLPISPRHQEGGCNKDIQSILKREHKESPFSSLVSLKQTH